MSIFIMILYKILFVLWCLKLHIYLYNRIRGKDASLIYWLGRDEYYASADRALVWADPDFATSLGIDPAVIKGYLPNENSPLCDLVEVS